MPYFNDQLSYGRWAVNQPQGIEMQITDYFKQCEAEGSRQEAALQALMNDIAGKKQGRNEKKIIAGLLENMETESDHTRLQFYRQALELLLRGDKA